MMDPVDALIFDVDGTLAETEETHRLSFNEAFAEAGLPWVWGEALYRELLDVTGGKERMAHFIDGLPARSGQPEPWRLEASDDLIRRLHARKTEIYATRVAAGGLALRPGIEHLIRRARARGVALAIATTTSRPNIDALIGSTIGEDAVGWFASIACGDRVAAKKPAPDVYRLALRELGVPAERAVAIEDSWNGIRAARAAGLRVIATPSLYTVGDDLSEATHTTSADCIAAALGWD